MVNYKEQQRENNVLQDRNVRNEYKDLSTQEIKTIVDANSLPFSVACLSLTGDLNVGSIIRSSHLFGAERVFVIGRRVIDKRSMVGVQNYIDIHRIEGRSEDMQSIDADQVYNVFVENNLVPVVLELDGTPLPKMEWKRTHADIALSGKQLCLTVGNEGLGIDKNVLDRLMSIKHAVQVSIPQKGAVRSHNVANSAAIVMTHMVDHIGWWDER